MGCESVDSKFKAKSVQILALSRSSALDSDPAPLYTWRPWPTEDSEEGTCRRALAAGGSAGREAPCPRSSWLGCGKLMRRTSTSQAISHHTNPGQRPAPRVGAGEAKGGGHKAK